MQLIRGTHNLKIADRGCVATIGNFDGVHLGHQAVLARVMAQAEALSLPSLVMLFEPQPMEYFRPEAAPARLTSVREKIQILAKLGIDRVLVIQFDHTFSQLTADEFIQELLVEKLAVQHLFVGDDFSFGKGRTGNFETLVLAGQQHGFRVENMDSIAIGQARISSTLIRQSLLDGDMKTVECMLGRPYALCGRVTHGNKRGRTIGFPTINLPLHRRVSPVWGIFAVRVNGLGEHALPGVASIGNRPMVEGDDRFLLEVHLFDFDRQIYGERVETELVAKLRDEQKFESFEIMRQQIVLDAEQAREILSKVNG